MANSTRLNPAQQFQIAPHANEAWLLISDPSDNGKYKHILLSSIIKQVQVSIPTDTILEADITAGIKVFTVMQPAPFYEPQTIIVYLNGFLNGGSVQSIVQGSNIGEYIITVTGFADNALDNDRMDLMIHWGHNLQDFINNSFTDNNNFITDQDGVLNQ